MDVHIRGVPADFSESKKTVMPFLNIYLYNFLTLSHFKVSENILIHSVCGYDCIAHARQKTSYIVGLNALQLAYF